MRQIIVAVRRKAYPPLQKGIVNLSLTFGAVKTVIHSAAAVIIGINLAGRDDGDTIVPGPGYHSSKIRQNPAVIPYARLACSEEKITLSAYVYQDPATAGFYQLPNHEQRFSLNCRRYGPKPSINGTYLPLSGSELFIGAKIPVL
jgi:hypothetical protein